MTLQERYDAAKAEAAQLGERHQQTRAHLMQLEQALIRADARMALLEELLKPESALTLVPSEKPLEYVG